jgi:hypothetical protein
MVSSRAFPNPPSGYKTSSAAPVFYALQIPGKTLINPSVSRLIMWREPMIRLLLALLPLAAFAADPALTIYNQNFAVVRETNPP